MIRHTKHLITLFLLFCFFSCSEGKVQQAKSQPADTVSTQVTNSGTFGFYKSFAFCESEIGYFAQEEADSIYAYKTLTVSKKDTRPVDMASVYSESEWKCISSKLGISDPAVVEIVNSKEPFPFDKLVLINSKYLLAARDAYYFVFTEASANSPVNEAKASSNEAFESLFSKKLIGLSIVDKKAESVFKKYGIDFVSECMCNTPSVYIDKQKSQIILFNYCEGSKQLAELENKVVLNIAATRSEGNKLIFNTEQNIKFTFSKGEHPDLFEMSIAGKLSKDYIGSELKRYFTTQPEKFKKAACDDYGG